MEYIRKPEDIPPLFAERGIKMPKRLLLEADELTYNEYIRLDKVFQPEEAGNATAFMRNLRRVKPLGDQADSVSPPASTRLLIARSRNVSVPV